MTTTTKVRAPKATTSAKGMAGKSSRKVATTKATMVAAKAKAKMQDASKPGDMILTSKATANSTGHYVSANDGRSTTIPTTSWKGEVRTASAVGQSYDEFCKVWSRVSAAKLANGVSSRAAPHSAKSVSDAKPVATPAKGKATPAPKGKATPAKAAKPAPGADRTYKHGPKANDARVGTWRAAMLGVILAHTSTAKANAAQAKAREFSDRKLDFNWCAKEGYITFA